ncbi:MAG: helix-turn-helix transcriptional regulator [Ilumatobacteraceae bacterium]
MRQQPATVRLRRLLVMLPWLMERGEVPLVEVSERFKIDADSLVRDLELVAMCGLPPYVDEMIDVFIDDGMVMVGVPRLFTRPLRLNRVEAFELLAAGRAAMNLPGSDPDGALNRGLHKVARGLGEDETGVIVINPTPESVGSLVDAASAGRSVRVSYQSHTAEAPSERVLSPYRVFSAHGHWYVVAHDDRSGEVRTFRVDRVSSIADAGPATASPPDGLPEPDDWFVEGDVERATLRIGPAGRWVVERYPVDEVSAPDDDGWVRVRLPVTSERWLERLLLRLGSQAEVIEPHSMSSLGRLAAERVLVNYR